MTKIYLITGFLGSGKTSFIKHLLNSTHEKVGVLVNEFGSVSIDGPLLRNNSTYLMELNNGSIFCSCIKDNFIKSLSELILMGMQTVFIESSGLSDPSNMSKILDILHLNPYLNFHYEGSICLVDGLNFEKEIAIMTNVERQIKHSEIILLNKTDLINREKIRDIHGMIHKINCKAVIHDVVLGKIPFETLTFPPEKTVPEETLNSLQNRPFTINMRIRNNVDPFIIKEMLEQVKSYFIRIKGIIRNPLHPYYHTVETVQDEIIVMINKDISSADQVIVFISITGTHVVSHLIKAAETYIPGNYEIMS